MTRAKGHSVPALFQKATRLSLQYFVTRAQKFSEIHHKRPETLGQFAERLGKSRGEQIQTLGTVFDTSLSSWPGCRVEDISWPVIGAGGPPLSAHHKATQARNNHFNILGDGFEPFHYESTPGGFEGVAFDCRSKDNAATAQTRRMSDLIAAAQSLVGSQTAYDGTLLDAHTSGSYRPVDWHLDNKTGYRWGPDLWRGDIRPCSPMGTDIKIPRELSRFQHTFYMIAGGRGLPVDTGVWWILQVLDWICANPLNFGVNWGCPMDVAIRMVNWVWGLSLLRSHPVLTPAVRLIILKSLYEHGLFVEKHREYSQELTNNHYLANITGLIVTGAALPMLPESDRWLLFGARELVKEMGRTVYPDGVSYEMSTAYHRLVSEMFLHGVCSTVGLSRQRRKRLANAQDGGSIAFRDPAIFPAWFYRRLYRMAQFTGDMTKPNGRVPVIGDNDNGRFVKLTPIFDNTKGDGDEEFRDQRHILAVAGALFQDRKMAAAAAAYALDGQLLAQGLSREALDTISARVNKAAPADSVLDESRPRCSDRNHHLKVSGSLKTGGASAHLWPHGGIAVLKNENAWICFTGGPNGQNNRGGHNHNDKLSFEMNIRGRDLVVDPGLYVYTPLPAMRNLFRSTTYHNTLVVTGKEQNPFTDFDPQFPSTLFELKDACNCIISAFDAASVSGKHTGYDIVHFRRVHLGENDFAIEDRFADGGELHFHLAPGLTPAVAGQSVRIEGLPGPVQIETEGMGDISRESYFVCPAYGRKVASSKIRMQREHEHTRVVFRF